MAMFPLGSVLLPGMVLPLHVFEDRYRRLVDDVLAAAEPEFGVTLIERGSEVGGGDVRVMTGCTARILEAARSADGRWALVTVGTQRFRVLEWLADAPYPRARVAPWPDEGPVPADAVDRFARLDTRVRRIAALASELGAPSAALDPEFSEDPVLHSYQLAVLSPLGPLDRLRVLETPGLARRLEVLADLVEEQTVLLEARLRFEGEGPVDPSGD